MAGVKTQDQRLEEWPGQKGSPAEPWKRKSQREKWGQCCERGGHCPTSELKAERLEEEGTRKVKA